MSHRYLALSGTVLVLLAGCSSDSNAPSDSFLNGTGTNSDIGVVLNSLGKSVTLFQLGAKTNQQEIPLGASSAVTPINMAVRGTHAAVPLGDAGSVAVIDLDGARIQRFFTFPSGNASGIAFVDDTTVVVNNTTHNYVGRFTFGQTASGITQTAPVAPAPSAIVAGNGKVFVISANFDENFVPLGPGIVTAINPATMAVLGTVNSGGENAMSAAMGPDGRLYVVNTGDYVSDGSVTIIDPATLQVIATVPGFGPGPGSIHIDANGLAYVSGFFTGTLVWNTATRAFVRGVNNPICAKNGTGANAPCRGAFDATRAADGSIYQLFFGSPSENLPPYAFVYAPTTYQLIDSIPVGVGPVAIEIKSFAK